MHAMYSQTSFYMLHYRKDFLCKLCSLFPPNTYVKNESLSLIKVCLSFFLKLHSHKFGVAAWKTMSEMVWIRSVFCCSPISENTEYLQTIKCIHKKMLHTIILSNRPCVVSTPLVIPRFFSPTSNLCTTIESAILSGFSVWEDTGHWLIVLQFLKISSFVLYIKG